MVSRIALAGLMDAMAVSREVLTSELPVALETLALAASLAPLRLELIRRPRQASLPLDHLHPLYSVAVRSQATAGESIP